MTNLVASFQGDGATPAARMSNPNPNGPIIPPGSSLGLLNDVGYGGYGPIRDISNKAPYEQSWSFGVQHETRWNLVLDASYIGKEGTHLYFALPAPSTALSQSGGERSGAHEEQDGRTADGNRRSLYEREAAYSPFG